MNEDILLARKPERSVELDSELRVLIEKRRNSLGEISARRGGGEDWDAPLDLRIVRPMATDLRALWAASNEQAPPMLAGALGSTRPVLLTHTVTPFSIDGRAPSKVWGLGYEMITHGTDANTVAVAPTAEAYQVAEIGQTIALGIGAHGSFALGEGQPGGAPGVRVSVSQRFQFEASLKISLRKVIGAPVGIGGALWKMYRQNEPLDQPHTLLQLLLVPEEEKELRCTVATWATQVGWLGTSWGARFWPYDDQAFTIRLDDVRRP